jgi:hypothetical protein
MGAALVPLCDQASDGLSHPQGPWPSATIGPLLQRRRPGRPASSRRRTARGVRGWSWTPADDCRTTNRRPREDPLWYRSGGSISGLLGGAHAGVEECVAAGFTNLLVVANRGCLLLRYGR